MAARNKIVVAWKKNSHRWSSDFRRRYHNFSRQNYFLSRFFPYAKKKLKIKKAEKDVLCNILTYSKPDVFLA